MSVESYRDEDNGMCLCSSAEEETSTRADNDAWDFSLAVPGLSPQCRKLEATTIPIP